MKTIIKIAALLILAITISQGKAQISICLGNSTVVTAVNSSGLSSPSYSMNPGGITSPNPTFAVAPAASVTYTLYVTGTNSSSAVVTTTTTVTVQVYGVTYSPVSAPGGFLIGCASASACVVSIPNAQTLPVPGGPVSYTFIPPGSSTVLPPSGILSPISVASITVPGVWTIVVRDNTSLCSIASTVAITQNTVPPTVGSVSVSQNPITCTTPSALVQATPNSTVLYTWLPSSTQGNSIIVASNITNTSTSTQSVAATLTLVVTNVSNLCPSTTVIPVYMNMYPPNAAITSPTLSSCQSTVVLTNVSTSGIPPGTFPSSGPVVGLLWSGPAPQPTAALSTTYLAQTTGIYTMIARDNNNGCTKTATCNVTIGAAAAFVHTITSGVAVFNNVSTGTSTSTIYFWDFGDGNTSTAQNPTHTYTNGGSHLVKLKITDPGTLCADSVIQSVYISGVPCSANSNFSMVPTSTAQIWNVVPSYPWNVSAASWSWGDGSTSNTLYTSHQYSAAGMYNICLSVTVSCVASSSTCTSYSIYHTTQQAMIVEVNVVAPDLILGLHPTAVAGQLSWNIAPNPNAGEFNLTLNNPKSGQMRVVISDLTGRIVHDQLIEPDSGTVSVRTDNLPQGLYLVTLESDKLKVTKRMVIHQ